jgi:hypothetical protein
MSKCTRNSLLKQYADFLPYSLWLWLNDIFETAMNRRIFQDQSMLGVGLQFEDRVLK